MKKILLITILVTFTLAQNIEITSKEFEADQQKLISKFIGDVVVKRAKDILKSQKLFIYFDKNKKPLRLVAIGNVIFEVYDKNGKFYKGRAQKIEYFPNKKEYLFYEQVHIVQMPDNRKIFAQKVILDLKSSHIQVSGEDKKPVKIILKLKETK